MLHLHDQLDGIQVDTLTGTGVQCPFERLGHLLAEVLTHVLRQLDADPILSGWPTLTSARATQLALVDHLEGTDLGVRMVLLVGWLAWLCAQREQLVQRSYLVGLEIIAFPVRVAKGHNVGCCHDGIVDDQGKRGIRLSS